MWLAAAARPALKSARQVPRHWDTPRKNLNRSTSPFPPPSPHAQVAWDLTWRAMTVGGEKCVEREGEGGRGRGASIACDEIYILIYICIRV